MTIHSRTELLCLVVHRLEFNNGVVPHTLTIHLSQTPLCNLRNSENFRRDEQHTTPAETKNVCLKARYQQPDQRRQYERPIQPSRGW
jgi:hypothetical protein